MTYDGGGWLLVKFPFKRVFPTAAVCAAVRHFSTKTFKPLNDTHHVDCLNVLQVIKPPGNLNLIRNSKPLKYLESIFIDSTEFEKEAGDFFNE